MTDIDGVITDAEGQLDIQAVAAIRDLEAKACRVGLISGRPYPMVLMLGEFLGVTGPLIGENGGAGRYGETEFRLGSRREIAGVVSEVRGRNGLRPAWDDEWRVTDFAFEREENIGWIGEMLAQESAAVEVQVSSIMVHFAKKGVTKGAALEHWISQVRLNKEQVVVAGDSDSDLSMFDSFCQSIAPSSATASVAERALYRAQRPFGEGFVEGVRYCRSEGIL